MKDIGKSSRKPIDFWIFMTVLILLAFGIIMVFSASAPYAYNYMKGDTYHFLRNQMIWAVLGFGGMFVMMNVDYRTLGKLSPILLAVSIGLLVIVLIPGIGTVLNGARRWFSIGGQSFQPSEIAKLAVIFFFAYSLSKRSGSLESFVKGLLPYLSIIGFFAVLLMLEPHFSCTMIIAIVGCIILYSAGAKIMHFVMLSVPVVVALAAAVMFSEYRRDRLISFLDPFKDPRGDGWQVVQSLYAIGSGGLFGKGLGRSLQKFLYIPEPYNDFILSVLAEELGFVGVCVVLALFLIFIWRGVKISMNAPDVFGSLLAIGITSLVAVQVVVNVAVVTSSMPVTGMPLPFFSAGGSSLTILMCAVGVLLNISRYANYERI